MKCKVCGTVNEDYLEYCENCAALLPTEEVEEVVEETVIEEVDERTAEEIYEARKSWTFVSAPTWRKVEFDANTVTEEDIPENKVIFSAPVVSLTEEDISSTVDEAAQKIAAQKEVAERAAIEAAKRNATKHTSPTFETKIHAPVLKSPVKNDPDDFTTKVHTAPVVDDTANKRRPLSAVRKPLAVKKPEIKVEPAEEKVSTVVVAPKTEPVEAPKAEPVEAPKATAVEAPKATAVESSKVAPVVSEDLENTIIAKKPIITDTASEKANVSEAKEEVKKEETALNKQTHSKKQAPQKEKEDEDFAPDEYDDDYDEYYDEDDHKTFSFGEFFARLFKKRSKSDDEEALESEAYEDESEDEDEGSKGSTLKRFKKTFIVAGISVVAILAVVFLAVTIGNNFDGNWNRFFSYTFGSYPLRKPATIETALLDDEPARIITVYAKKGHSIRFMDKVYEVTGDLIQFRVSDQLWMPNEPVDSATIEVTPELYVIAPDGTETPVEFANSIVITLPTLELNIKTPSVTEIPSASGFVDFVGSVTDLAASVFINDIQVQVDESGNFSARYSDLAAGVNTLNVEARKNGYQIARKTFTVTNGAAGSTPAPGTLALAFDQGENRFRTTTDSITVSGNMEKDAVIAVSGVTLAGEVTQDPVAGTFSFTVHAPEVKVYSVNVTATKNGVAYTKTIYLERAPEDKDAYMDATVALDYNALKNNPSSDSKYVVKAAIKEISQTDPYFKLLITTENGDLIVCYYNNLFTANEFSENAEFKFYGDPHGTDSETGLPMIHAWYVKKYSN